VQIPQQLTSHPQRPQRIDPEPLLDPGEVERLETVPAQNAGIVHEHVEPRIAQRRGETRDALVGRDVDAFDKTDGQRPHGLARRAADADHRLTALAQPASELETDATVAAGDQPGCHRRLLLQLRGAVRPTRPSRVRRMPRV